MEATVRCPTCTTEVAATAIACPTCGAHLLVELRGYCSTCHAVVAADRIGRCPTCGGPVADLQPRDVRAVPGEGPAAPGAELPPARAPAPQPPAAPPIASVPAVGTLLPAPAPGPPEAGPLRERLVIPGPPPEPVPVTTSAGRRLAIGCAVFAVVLLVVGAVVGGLFLATGGIEMLKPVAPVTFDTINDYPEYRRVAILGRLSLPGRLHCEDTCGVWLEDPADSGRRVGLFIRVPDAGETTAPNQMERMPTIYATEDFRVRLADGGWVGDGDVVRVTGPVCRTEEKHDVCVTADELEQGD